MQFIDAVEKFKLYLMQTDKSKETMSGYEKDLKNLHMFLEKTLNCTVYLEEILTEDLEAYILYRKECGLSTSTRARNLHSIKSFYRFCHKKKYIPQNIAYDLEPIKVNRKEREYLSTNEQIQLLKTIRYPIIQIIAFTLLHTGLRISECVNLKTYDVSFKHRQIKVREGKGNKDRIIPMSRDLYQELKQYASTERKCIQESDYFFATQKTGRVSTQYVNRVLKETAKELKWEKTISAHILRHTFASTLLAKGANIVEIQRLLGHSDLKTTSCYVHTTMKQLNRTVNLLNS
ncbi:MAG TPA: tyrosine-type recombinase/integrase [Firmicutes bacterium]|nr:tyrosine-type recombinase/integrase [Bacillales bacterium]HJA41434.1 tyrosine-type recombinase/integrase [Bacillota bacterium]